MRSHDTNKPIIDPILAYSMAYAEKPYRDKFTQEKRQALIKIFMEHYSLMSLSEDPFDVSNVTFWRGEVSDKNHDKIDNMTPQEVNTVAQDMFAQEAVCVIGVELESAATNASNMVYDAYHLNQANIIQSE